MRVIVHGENAVDAGQLEHFRVQLGGVRLAIELLHVGRGALELGFAEFRPGSPVLSTVEEIGFHQHHMGGAVFFGSPGDQQVAHGEILPADHPAGGADDDHARARELCADAAEILLVGDEAGQNSEFANVFMLMRSAMSSV